MPFTLVSPAGLSLLALGVASVVIICLVVRYFDDLVTRWYGHPFTPKEISDGKDFKLLHGLVSGISAFDPYASSAAVQSGSSFSLDMEMLQYSYLVAVSGRYDSVEPDLMGPLPGITEGSRVYVRYAQQSSFGKPYWVPMEIELIGGAPSS